MKATADNALLSAFYGTDVDRVGAVAWGTGVMLSGIVGIVFAAQTALTLDVSNIGLIALPAIVLGGFDSVEGGILGGLIVAFSQTAITTATNPTVADMCAYAVVFLVLLVRPQGLLARGAVRRV